MATAKKRNVLGDVENALAQLGVKFVTAELMQDRATKGSVLYAGIGTPIRNVYVPKDTTKVLGDSDKGDFPKGILLVVLPLD